MSTIDTNIWQAAGVSESSAGTSDLGQADFLELMLTQLNNQNPMEPMDNGEFLGQIAQFSAVSGIQELQASFSELSSSLVSSQALQASTLVGHGVLVESDMAILPADGGMNGAVNLTSSTNQLVVGIYDTSGQLIRRIDLGGQEAGVVEFAWDGYSDGGQLAAPGNYVMRAEAQFGNEAAAMQTYAAGQVESVTLSNSGILLNLDGLGTVSFYDVIQIMS